MQFAVFAICAVTGSTVLARATECAAQAAPERGHRGGEALVWSDEFNGHGKPDRRSWTYAWGGDGGGNAELQFYTERLENARVESGHLVIEARKERYRGREYTSGRLVTKKKVDFLYGRFEICAKLPAGRGTWPAFWMLPVRENRGPIYWPDNGEIDIMEHVGWDPTVIHGSLHMKNHNWLNGTEITGVTPINDFDSAFHVYGMDWAPNEISFSIDGIKYVTYKNPHTDWGDWPFDRSFYLIFNVAIGGSWGGGQGVDDAIFPVQMVVDSVRVYKNTRGR